LGILKAGRNLLIIAEASGAFFISLKVGFMVRVMELASLEHD
jgi:hypothetical protein